MTNLQHFVTKFLLAARANPETALWSNGAMPFTKDTAWQKNILSRGNRLQGAHDRRGRTAPRPRRTRGDSTDEVAEGRPRWERRGVNEMALNLLAEAEYGIGDLDRDDAGDRAEVVGEE